MEGLEVSIADEAIFLIESTGEQLTLEQYRDYTKHRILRSADNRTALRDIWVDSTRRRAFLEELRRSSIHPEVLAEVLASPKQTPSTFSAISPSAALSAPAASGPPGSETVSKPSLPLTRKMLARSSWSSSTNTALAASSSLSRRFSGSHPSESGAVPPGSAGGSAVQSYSVSL